MVNVRKASFWVLLAFVASIPTEDSISFHIGRISKVLGLLALGVWVLAVASTGRLRRPVPAQWVATSFVVWALLSYFWTSTQHDTLVKVFTFAQLLAVVWLICDQVVTENDLIKIMRAFLLGSLAATMLTLAGAIFGKAVEGSRFASNNSGPNNTGALLAVSVAMAFLLLRMDPNRRYRILYVASIPASAVGLLLTASRTAAISLAVCLAIIGLDRRLFTARWMARLLPVALIAFVVAAFLVPQRTLDRLGTTSTEISSGTLNGRTAYWDQCLQLFYDHPLQGIGSGAFPNANLKTGTVAHNAFLSILAELGAIGIILFVGTILMAAFGLLREERRRRRAWLAIGATWFVGANALTWEVRKITWFLLAIALVQARITAQRRAEVRQHVVERDEGRHRAALEALARAGAGGRP